MGYVVYDPFGEVLTSALPLTVIDRLFTGQRWDATIGLYEHAGKFYDPQLGILIQPPGFEELLAQAPFIASNRANIGTFATGQDLSSPDSPLSLLSLLSPVWNTTLANKLAGKIVDEVVERIFPEEIFVQIPPHPSTIEWFKLRGLEPPDGEWLSRNNPLRSDFMNQVFGVGVDIAWQALADLGTEMPLDERLARAVFGSGAGGYLGGQGTKWLAKAAFGIANPGFGVALISGYLVEPIVGDIFMDIFYTWRGYSDIE